MNWKCPVCGSEDNSSDFLRCSCGHEEREISEFVINPLKKKRPIGFTFLAFILFSLGIAAFGGLFTFSQHTIFHKIINVGYGLTALITAVGLWKLKDWVQKTYLAWCISVIFLMLYLQFGASGIYRTNISGFIPFAVFISLILAGISKYISRKIMNLQSA